MNLRRVLFILRSRWWIVVAVAAIAAIAAVVVTHQRNTSIRRTHVANAPLEFVRLDRETDDQFNNRLAGAQTDALDILADMEVGQGRLDVRIDRDGGRLQFVATERNPDLAEELAVGFRSSYVNAEPNLDVVETIRERMAEIADDIEKLDRDLKTLQAVEDPEPVAPEVEEERRLLEAQITELQKRADGLALALTLLELGIEEDQAVTDRNDDETEEPPTPEELQAELDSVNAKVLDLRSQVAALPTPEEPDAPSLTEGLDATTLETLIANLEDEYVALSLSLQEGGEQAVIAGDVTVLDQTPEFRSRRDAGLIALLIGALAAAVVVIGVEQARRTAWTLDDFEGHEGLATVPRRPRTVPEDKPWYSWAAPNRRRREIQKIRTSLDGPMSGGPFTLGLSDLGARPGECQALAADIAASLAVAGRKVLLLDADFDHPADLAEYRPALGSLGDVLNGTAADVDLFLAGLPESAPGLTAMQPGTGLADPADGIAGQPFRALLASAKERFDVIIVTAPSVSHPVTTVLTQRLDYVVLVAKEGRTRTVDIDDVTRDLTHRHAEMLGVVMVGRMRTRVKTAKPASSGRRPVPAVRRPPEPDVVAVDHEVEV